MGRQGKVTDEMRRLVLADVKRGISYRQIGPRYGVTETTIRRIVHAQDVAERQPERKRRDGSLTVADREEIMVGIVRGESCPTIAARIGFDRSTVWREIRRNGGRASYRAHEAEQRSMDSARRPRPAWTETKPWLWSEVCRLLAQKWSPEQIAARLSRDHDQDPAWSISHESIYQAVFQTPDKTERKRLTGCLRSRRARRRKRGRRTNGQMPPIVGMVNISERPIEIENRDEFGHWEGDLVVGRNGRSFVATLVERSTRIGLLIKLENKTSAHVAAQLATWVSSMSPEMVRTLTWDQGTELAAHVHLSTTTGVPIYFCDPHSPWQRGTNENWNGLVRQFLRRALALGTISQGDLNHISHLLNTRPRRTLGWDTPEERFHQVHAQRRSA